MTTPGNPLESTTLSALRDLAAGRGVKRGRHELRVDVDSYHDLFLEALRLEGFEPARVRDLELEPGERVPAFLVRGDRADFGWVFRERFTEVLATVPRVYIAIGAADLRGGGITRWPSTHTRRWSA
jgi:hypothetical protein